jgi:hypothetical protein
MGDLHAFLRCSPCRALLAGQNRRGSALWEAVAMGEVAGRRACGRFDPTIGRNWNGSLVS